MSRGVAFKDKPNSFENKKRNNMVLSWLVGRNDVEQVGMMIMLAGSMHAFLEREKMVVEISTKCDNVRPKLKLKSHRLRCALTLFSQLTTSLCPLILFNYYNNPLISPFQLFKFSSYPLIFNTTPFNFVGFGETPDKLKTVNWRTCVFFLVI